jgi:hypothetical protein
MLMEAFGENGKHLVNVVIINSITGSGVYITRVNDMGLQHSFWTDLQTMLEKRDEMGFKIINKSGQELPPDLKI